MLEQTLVMEQVRASSDTTSSLAKDDISLHPRQIQ